MERIFGETSVYSEEAKSELKQVMLVTDQDKTDFPIYGLPALQKAEKKIFIFVFTLGERMIRMCPVGQRRKLQLNL